MDRSSLSYWESLFVGNARAWVAPITPAAEDIAHVERQVAAHKTPSPRALLLGVTQGLARMHWPKDTSLIALDWSSNLIRQIWSAAAPLDFAHVVRGDWREMPLARASLDIAVGDGCYAALGSYADADLLNAELHRALRPGALFCQRCFARPDPVPSIDALLGDLRAGRFPNVFLFRWWFMMAVHGASRDGVALDEFWQAWRACREQARPELERRGWWQDAEWTFGRFRGASQRYIFPHPDELRALVAPYFDLIEYRVPGYERGECFPSLVMQPRA